MEIPKNGGKLQNSPPKHDVCEKVRSFLVVISAPKSTIYRNLLPPPQPGRPSPSPGISDEKPIPPAPPPHLQGPSSGTPSVRHSLVHDLRHAALYLGGRKGEEAEVAVTGKRRRHGVASRSKTVTLTLIPPCCCTQPPCCHLRWNRFLSPSFRASEVTPR